ncbi:hypothetical protein AC629_20460 [Bradyrhizobium sp. NAS80.1]|uniref:hypothetical protein n=1 Tax=Bradyrhizobium sp. NAS80.1 TaxID=1680159 RepID=UPI000965E973|nr:hypothetical protein [Bradyrhizobium sp. NAS80.1]OKO84776.1 hypothetical protein AC629_20460 [Bradyrhizobium sp. NAS80.1]
MTQALIASPLHGGPESNEVVWFGHAKRPAFTFAAVVAGVCSLAVPAHAHGFGQRYDLPLPLSLYLFGAAAAVVLSFVIVGLPARHAPGASGYPRIDLLASPLRRQIARALGTFLKVFSIGLLVLTVIAGSYGSQNPYQNIAPTLVWIIWWVGLAVFSALFGDLWALINPWHSLFDCADRLYRSSGGRALGLHRPYPKALAVWPAFALLLAVSWTELVFPSPAVPVNIAWLALFYSLITWAGMAVFGSEAWVKHGEVFSVFFGVFARFAPTEPSTRDLSGEHGLALRPFGAGLLATEPASTSMVAFVLLVLSSVLYDGLLSTPEWAEVERQLLGVLPSLGEVDSIIVRTIGLVAFWALFFGAYVAVSAIMSMVAAFHSPWEIARNFAFTLVPIAIAYHLAHYLVYLLTQGQYIVPLASDPFGYGWNLFGTAGYRVDIAVVGARFAWYAAVTSIVLGHIAAVYLADVRARQILESRGAALRSQVPLTALMVVYTFVSLSILAEPIVERRTPAQPTATLPEALTIPEDALIPELGTGRLQPVGAGRSATLKLTYRVLGSAFHDGTRATFADLLYAYMFAYRWSAPGEAHSHYDPVIAAATAPLRQRLAGVRVAGVDPASKSFRVGDVNFVRELFVVDVYANIPPEDPEQDAVFAPPWSTLPWHLLVLMEEAASRGWAAFSQAEAARRGVEWLDLVRSDTLKARLATLTDQFEQEGFRPEILRSQVSAEEARKRWAAMAAFYRDHGHFLVTNGPYQLKSWTGDSATLKAFRDLSYPLGVGSYDAYAIPRRSYVTKVERDSDRLRVSADIEILVRFMREYRILRRPMQSVDAVLLKRAAPECRYAVLNADGRVVLTGAARLGEDLTFRIEFDGKLPPGQYDVMVEIIVNGDAMIAQIERIPVVIGGRPASPSH